MAGVTDYPLSRDFRASEFVCSHCGASGIHLEFVERLQGLRDALGKPMVITSGYRCHKHPVEAKKATPGQHTKGIAADLYSPGVPLKEIYRRVLADFPEFTGIGAAPHQRFLHLDTRAIPKGQRAVVWAYDRNGNTVRWSGRWEELPK